VKDDEADSTERPYYERVSTLDLKKHIDIVESSNSDRAPNNNDDNKSIEEGLPAILDKPWPADIPRWRIVIQRLSSDQPEKSSRTLITFAFCHSIGDGMSGLIFHRCFLEALQNMTTKSSATLEDVSIIDAPQGSISPPFDTKGRLPITWSYLLTPLLAVYMSKSIAAWFGLRAAASTVDAGTWTGPKMFYDKDRFLTGVHIMEIEATLLSKVLATAKSQDAKFTAVFHGAIVRALSKAIPADQQATVTNIVSSTAVNMRDSIRTSSDEMGLFVTGYYDIHPKIENPVSLSDSPTKQNFLESAKVMTAQIAKCAVRLVDQPIGLLRYLPSIRTWTTSKLGLQRDCSYEVSNLGRFVPKDNGNTAFDRVNITKMVFCQPANVHSAPLVFNLVSVKGGSLICAVNWQIGATGVPETEEKSFVNGICQSIKEDFETLQ
jgi:hypothetical protein